MDQPDFSKFPKTPLDYRNDVGTGFTLQEAQALARPCTLSTMKQELIRWHHHIYHLTFRIIFRLTSIDFLSKRLLKLQNKSLRCVVCQLGAAHCRPWWMKGRKSGLIRRPEQSNPGDGVSVDQIVSAQLSLRPQMSGFMTSQHFWGCTTFLVHVSG